MKQTGLLLFSLALAANLQATELRGPVTAIIDGDTLTVLIDRQPVRVRLAEIDAPEQRQAFGQRAKQSLAELCAGQEAVIEDKGRDRYQRVLARVRCADLDAGTEQLRRGMAWVYDRYVTDRSLYASQAEAQANKRGLWRDPAPVAPWQFRKDKN